MSKEITIVEIAAGLPIALDIVTLGITSSVIKLGREFMNELKAVERDHFEQLRSEHEQHEKAVRATLAAHRNPAAALLKEL